MKTPAGFEHIFLFYYSLESAYIAILIFHVLDVYAVFRIIDAATREIEPFFFNHL